MTTDELFTIREAAEAIGISRQRLSKLIADGRVDTVTRGHVSFVPLTAITEQQQIRADHNHGPGLTLPPPDGYFTTAQVAEQFGITQGGVLHWIHVGTVKAEVDTIDPRRYIIAASALEGFDPPGPGRPTEGEQDA